VEKEKKRGPKKTIHQNIHRKETKEVGRRKKLKKQQKVGDILEIFGEELKRGKRSRREKTGGAGENS